MDRGGFYAEESTVHHDWRSPHFTTSSSPFGLGRGEMKKTTKKTAPKKSETKRDAPIIVGGVVLPPREHDDFIGRDPRSVR